MTNLDQFMARYLGVKNTGDTPQNKGQCVGLVEVWLDALSRPHIWGDAKDLMANAVASDGIVIRNTPTNFPKAGDIVVWGASWGHGHGHTAVVVAANRMHLAVFEQNNPVGMPPTIATHSYDGVIGWVAL